MNITEAVYKHNDQLSAMNQAVNELLSHIRGPIPESPNTAQLASGPMALLGDLEATGRKINDLHAKLSELAQVILSSATLGKSEAKSELRRAPPIVGRYD